MEVEEPKWLTDEIKELFDYEVFLSENGFRITRLTPKRQRKVKTR